MTPNEFLARAETLLDPAQFEILDRIRKRQPVGEPTAAGSTPAVSGPISTVASVGPTPTNMTAVRGGPGPSMPQHSISLPPVALPNRGVQPGQPFSGSQPTLVQTPNSSVMASKLPSSGPGAQSLALPPSSTTLSSPGGTGPQAAPVRKRTTDSSTAGGTPNEG